MPTQNLSEYLYLKSNSLTVAYIKPTQFLHLIYIEAPMH